MRLGFHISITSIKVVTDHVFAKWNLPPTVINIPTLRCHILLVTQLIGNRTSCHTIQG